MRRLAGACIAVVCLRSSGGDTENSAQKLTKATKKAIKNRESGNEEGRDGGCVRQKLTKEIKRHRVSWHGLLTGHFPFRLCGGFRLRRGYGGKVGGQVRLRQGFRLR